MFKHKINLNDHSFFYFIIGITFLVKIWAIFHFPFNEDELEYVRTAFLIKEGYVPFKDYIHISFPLFSYLLTPFVTIIPNPVICLFVIKIMLLIFSYMGLFFYYKAIQKWFPKKISMLSVVILNLSYIYYYQILLIRPSSFLFSMILFCFWFITNYSGKKFLKPAFLSAVYTFFILLDQRSCILILILIVYGILYRKTDWKILFYTFLFTGISLCFILLYFNPLSIQALMKLAHFFPTNRSDQTIFYLISAWQYDWVFILLSFYGFYSFYKGQNKVPGIIFLIICYCFLSFVVLSALRPDTFGIYVVPYISFFAAMGCVRIMILKIQYSKFIAVSMIIFLISLSNFLKQENHIFLKDQIEIMNLINKDQKQSVMNLSRFSLNLSSPLNFPILRFEEDILATVKNLCGEEVFFGILKQTLSDLSPEYILYSKKDTHLNGEIKSYIDFNYTQKSEYLYIRNKPKTKKFSYLNSHQIVMKYFEELKALTLKPL